MLITDRILITVLIRWLEVRYFSVRAEKINITRSLGRIIR
jgi:hypothetical protein